LRDNQTTEVKVEVTIKVIVTVQAGTFEFSDEAPDIDMEALAARYADSFFWSNAIQPGQLDLVD
jgi:hypothetical protein